MAEDVRDRLARTWKRLDVAKTVLEWAQEALVAGDEARALRLECSVLALLEILLMGWGGAKGEPSSPGDGQLHGSPNAGAVYSSDGKLALQLARDLRDQTHMAETWRTAALAAEANQRVAEEEARHLRGGLDRAVMEERDKLRLDVDFLRDEKAQAVKIIKEMQSDEARIRIERDAALAGARNKGAQWEAMRLEVAENERTILDQRRDLALVISDRDALRASFASLRKDLTAAAELEAGERTFKEALVHEALVVLRYEEPEVLTAENALVPKAVLRRLRAVVRHVRGES